MCGNKSSANTAFNLHNAGLTPVWYSLHYSIVPVVRFHGCENCVSLPLTNLFLVILQSSCCGQPLQ